MRGVGILLLGVAAAHGATLDYTFFKERVQPIFLAKRAGHARCVTCHSHGSPPLPALPSSFSLNSLKAPATACNSFSSAALLPGRCTWSINPAALQYCYSDNGILFCFSPFVIIHIRSGHG